MSAKFGRYRHHKYTWSKPFNAVYHDWSLTCADGGLNFHVSIYEDSPSCGLKIHRTAPADYQRGEAPHHLDCPVTGGRCWHERERTQRTSSSRNGTSLYARETLWPLIEGWLRTGDHEAIFRCLEAEADRIFGDAEEPENEAAA